MKKRVLILVALICLLGACADYNDGYEKGMIDGYEVAARVALSSDIITTIMPEINCHDTEMRLSILVIPQMYALSIGDKARNVTITESSFTSVGN